MRWKQWPTRAKLVGVLTVGSLVFGLYLETASLFERSGTSLPLGELFYNYSEVPLAAGLLGLAYIIKLQYQIPETNGAT